MEENVRLEFKLTLQYSSDWTKTPWAQSKAEQEK